MRGVTIVFAAVCVLCAAGCNTLGKQPEFKDALIEPATLAPGATGVITVKVVDKHEVVARVEGIVKEAPELKLQLKDDGNEKNGDAKAGDGIWSMKVDTRPEAPEGQYTLEFKAYRSDGLPVPIRLEEGGVGELTCTVQLVVAMPPAQ